ncbi:hypothetical protein [Thermoplasma volcanium]|nr:hypothetical protein [Thermoplasma volcanium]
MIQDREKKQPENGIKKYTNTDALNTSLEGKIVTISLLNGRFYGYCLFWVVRLLDIAL